jgi:NADP-dependent 3-hydroxy acid dehydrogenase YdfG
MTLSSDRYTLITGASSGIGQATALAFAEAGFPVALVGRSLDRLETIAQQILEQGGKAVPCAIDLAEVSQVKAQIQALTQSFGPIDILVNNAGIGYTAPLIDTPLADWQQVLNVNLTSVLQCIQAVLPQMRSRRQGTIVNLASIGGKQVFPDWGAYCVSKFGLVALSKTLSLEERTHGIRVITLCPGAVNTALWDAPTVHADFDRAAMLTPEVVAQTILQAVQLPPQAVIEELIVMPQGGTF